jgi:uncharacterized protein
MHSNDKATIRIGVLADSHVPHRIPAMPPRVYDLLRGSDMILHAGDLETPVILDDLRALAPLLGVHAVRGNLHWQFSTGVHDQDLPRDVTLAVGGHVIWMSHGHLYFGYSLLDKLAAFTKRPKLDTINAWIIARLARAKAPQADIVVFGHSHKPCAVQHNGTLYFNPGAVTGAGNAKLMVVPPSIGFLTLAGDGGVEHEWVAL